MPDNLRSLLRRYAGHLLFILMSLVMVWLGRDALASVLVAPAAELPAAETAGSTEPQLSASQSTTPEATVDAAVAPGKSADISAVPVLDDSSIEPAINPTTFEGKRPEHEFVTYVVERGDTPAGIADQFGIKPETLLGGNPFLGSEASLLQTGVELLIMPVDGLVHDVQPGDTLEGLAELYDVPVEDIIAYGPNNLEFPYRLYPETQIVVPGAVRELFVWNPPQLTTSNSNSYWASQSQAFVEGTGTFVWPVNSRNFTQYYWYGHQAIDVGLPEGTPVYATDTGTVTYATWSTYCFGNLIVVNHGNGYESFYAHLSGFNVVAGQIVTQGQLIGWSGNTGCSSGSHLHFEIRVFGNRDDPCWYLPGGC